MKTIRKYSDLYIKVLYDVPPGFAEMDSIKAEDGCISKADMEQLMDVLDGGYFEGDHPLPPLKGTMWSVWQEADVDKNGCVDEREFEKGNLGATVESELPTPHSEKSVWGHAAAGGNSTVDAVKGTGKAIADALVPTQPETVPKRSPRPPTVLSAGVAQVPKLSSDSSTETFFQHLWHLGVSLGLEATHPGQKDPLMALAESMDTDVEARSAGAKGDVASK